MRKHDSLEKDIITGTLPGKWARGRRAEDIMDEQHYCMDWANVKCYIEEDRGKKLMESCHLACGQPSDRGRLKEDTFTSGGQEVCLHNSHNY